MYNEKVFNHFLHPQNAYQMKDADGEGTYGDPECGDSLTIYVKIKDNTISEISYLVYGCCAAIATSSIASVIIKGKTIEQALSLTEEDIIQALDGLPGDKEHCSLLAISALKNAIKCFQEKKQKGKNL